MKSRKHRRPFAFSAAASARAEELQFTLFGLNSDVTFNGNSAQVVPLTLTFFDNTANLSDGTGLSGSNEYQNVTLEVTAPSLGLTNVSTTNLLSLDIGFPDDSNPLVQNKTVVLYNQITGGAQGFYNISTLPSWNEVSPFTAQNLVSYGGDLAMTLSNGDSLVLHSFDITPPCGYGAFTVTQVPLPAAALSGTLLAAILAASKLGLAKSSRGGKREQYEHS